MYTIIDNDNKYVYSDMEDVLMHVKMLYINEDVCMSEILADIEIQGISLEHAAELYMEFRNWADDNQISMIDEEGNFVL